MKPKWFLRSRVEPQPVSTDPSSTETLLSRVTLESDIMEYSRKTARLHPKPNFFLVRYLCDSKMQVRREAFIDSEEVSKTFYFTNTLYMYN